MSFLLLDALRDYLTGRLAGFPFLDPASRDRAERRRPPRVLIGELPPRNKEKERDPAADEGGYPFVLLRGLSGEDHDDFSTFVVSFVCAVAAVERGEAIEHEIHNMLAFVRTALLQKRLIGNMAELVPDKEGRLLAWSVYPEYAHPYVAGGVQGTYKLPGIRLTEESYVRD